MKSVLFYQKHNKSKKNLFHSLITFSISFIDVLVSVKGLFSDERYREDYILFSKPQNVNTIFN